ncbi:MAG: hypothetical protein LBH73_01330 [Spirochaetaceae bacterium]|nr:hypothetical protein [Spirochaetaceae bacterium]
MKGAPFRPAGEWKAALMTLPDAAFFELMRSVFGNIKTPFNKQKLLDDLAGFLARKDIQKTIAAYINERDKQIIAAIAVLGEPLPGELESFFGGELSYTELHSELLNLEERFIVYRFKDEGVSRLALNPALESVLGPFASDTELLFPAAGPPKKETKTRGKTARLSDSMLAAVFAFIYDQGSLFKAEGKLRKKVSDEGRRIFPGIKLEALFGSLQALALIRLDDDGSSRIDEEKLRSFAGLPPEERRIYLAAALTSYFEEPEKTNSWLKRPLVQALARVIYSFIYTLDKELLYPRSTLLRLFPVLFKSLNIETKKQELFIQHILKALEISGLLEEHGQAYMRCVSPDNSGGEEKPRIAIDAAFSLVLYPEIAFADALELARFCSVREAGTAPRFELTRLSAVRGFDRGITVQTMCALLTRLSGFAPDQSLAWTLADWEKRYHEVSFHRGLVLTLSKDRRYLAETAALSSLITRTLAPGVYLLRDEDRETAFEALCRAGVDIIAQPLSGPQEQTPLTAPYPSPASKLRGDFLLAGNSGKRPASGSEENPPRPAGKNPASAASAAATSAAASATNPANAESAGDTASAANPASAAATTENAAATASAANPADALKEHFRSLLSAMKLSKEEREELSARIERRLILTDSQLKDASVKYERLEARGLDYVGKQTVAKQAISLQSFVELSWPSGGKTERLLGIPQALEKNGGESILVLRTAAGAGNRDQAEEIRVPLAKISLIRRIKRSIFGT